MQAWQSYLQQLRLLLARVPLAGWAGAGVILFSLAVVFVMEMGGPPYVVLDDGLSPADGGKVIAQLQKLGIPYQLQAAGNLILVPAPQLAEARLQLGATQDPDGDVGGQWDRLENAPMTASDLAQNTMATQALQASLAQSIESLKGIRAAQVYLALPADTAFLGDQPKPSASVVISADDGDAAAQGEAIADLVAGAVPGLSAQGVSVATTDGVAVYPAAKTGTNSSQLGTVEAVENFATARVSQLLEPLVGEGNFRVGVSAALDFTQQQTHQISYGPTQLITHQTLAQTAQSGGGGGGGLPIGIPGAMSNEPPAATTAAAPPANGAAPAPGTTTSTGPSAAATTPPPPVNTSKNTDQTYVTDQSESNIVHPDWTVSSVAVSVVLNRQALGTLTTAQVKAAVAGAFAEHAVSVNVLAAPFQLSVSGVGRPWQSYAGLSSVVMEVVAAALLLFGLALPVGRRLGDLAAATARPALPSARAAAVTLRRHDVGNLRQQVGENLPSVARLLQNWVEDDG